MVLQYLYCNVFRLTVPVYLNICFPFSALNFSSSPLLSITHPSSLIFCNQLVFPSSWVLESIYPFSLQALNDEIHLTSSLWNFTFCGYRSSRIHLRAEYVISSYVYASRDSNFQMTPFTESEVWKVQIYRKLSRFKMFLERRNWSFIWNCYALLYLHHEFNKMSLISSLPPVNISAQLDYKFSIFIRCISSASFVGQATSAKINGNPISIPWRNFCSGLPFSINFELHIYFRWYVIF